MFIRGDDFKQLTTGELFVWSGNLWYLVQCYGTRNQFQCSGTGNQSHISTCGTWVNILVLRISLNSLVLGIRLKYQPIVLGQCPGTKNQSKCSGTEPTCGSDSCVNTLVLDISLQCQFEVLGSMFWHWKSMCSAAFLLVISNSVLRLIKVLL